MYRNGVIIVWRYQLAEDAFEREDQGSRGAGQKTRAKRQGSLSQWGRTWELGYLTPRARGAKAVSYETILRVIVITNPVSRSDWCVSVSADRVTVVSCISTNGGEGRSEGRKGQMPSMPILSLSVTEVVQVTVLLPATGPLNGLDHVIYSHAPLSVSLGEPGTRTRYYWTSPLGHVYYGRTQ